MQHCLIKKLFLTVLVLLISSPVLAVSVGIVTGDNVNLRSVPEMNGEVIGVVELSGTVVRLLQPPSEIDDWLSVKLEIRNAMN